MSDKQVPAHIVRAVPAEAHEYSGRFMYGKTCLSFHLAQGVHPMSVMADLLQTLVYQSDDLHADVEVVADLMAHAQTDQLGLGTVLYFPGYAMPAD